MSAQSVAHALLGRDLPNGWRAVERVTPASTGSCFSVGYLVERSDGTRGFLKALDLTRAMQEPDFVVALNNLTSAFRFERDLLERCRNRRLGRVVLAMEYGEAQIDPQSPIGRVPYLVFERADGDIRRALDLAPSFDLAWALRSLHQVAVGLKQLHSAGIAHQDVKPSNVLLFKSDGAKLADLGRASDTTILGPWDGLHFPGDMRYAPPEFIYGYVPTDWAQRRLGCDLYHLGSMAHFLFADISLTAALMQRVAPQHKRPQWTGAFDQVLPFLEHAFAEVLDEFAIRIPARFSDELVGAVRQLSHPDPRRRGHSITRQQSGSPYSLERFVSLFDRVASHAEVDLRRAMTR